MTDLTPEEQRIATSIADALGTGAGAQAAAAGGADLKNLFCTNWPTVKRVLEFLLGHLPESMQGTVKAILRIGDWLFSTVCPR